MNSPLQVVLWLGSHEQLPDPRLSFAQQGSVIVGMINDREKPTAPQPLLCSNRHPREIRPHEGQSAPTRRMIDMKAECTTQACNNDMQIPSRGSWTLASFTQLMAQVLRCLLGEAPSWPFAQIDNHSQLDMVSKADRFQHDTSAHPDHLNA